MLAKDSAISLREPCSAPLSSCQFFLDRELGIAAEELAGRCCLRPHVDQRLIQHRELGGETVDLRVDGIEIALDARGQQAEHQSGEDRKHAGRQLDRFLGRGCRGSARGHCAPATGRPARRGTRRGRRPGQLMSGIMRASEGSRDRRRDRVSCCRLRSRPLVSELPPPRETCPT